MSISNPDQQSMQSAGFDELDELYQEVVLDHYRSPRNNRLLESPDMESRGFNPFCGDEVKLTAHVNSTGLIDGLGFNGHGCAISQASASIMTDLLKGYSLNNAQSLITLFKDIMQGKENMEPHEETLGDLAALEGVKKFPVRVKCAVLAWSTMQDAIANYRKARDQ